MNSPVTDLTSTDMRFVVRRRYYRTLLTFVADVTPVAWLAVQRPIPSQSRLVMHSRSLRTLRYTIMDLFQCEIHQLCQCRIITDASKIHGESSIWSDSILVRWIRTSMVQDSGLRPDFRLERKRRMAASTLVLHAVISETISDWDLQKLTHIPSQRPFRKETTFSAFNSSASTTHTPQASHNFTLNALRSLLQVVAQARQALSYRSLDSSRAMSQATPSTSTPTSRTIRFQDLQW